MGNSIKKQQQQLHQGQIEQPRELTPLQQWNCSQKTQQDLTTMLKKVQSLYQCTNTIYQFIHLISKREKYHNYLIAVLDYLRSDSAIERFRDNDRKDMFTKLSKKLKHSFFVVQDFNESYIDYEQKPAQKLYFLYEYYSNEQNLFQKAIFINYPTIFTQFKQFIKYLTENEVVIQNEDHIYRFIVPYMKIEEIKSYFELTINSYTEHQREKLFLQVRAIQNMKEAYLQGVQQLMKYNYADLSSNFLKNMKAKGYQLTDNELQYCLKIEIYCIFLYQLTKLSLSFDFIRSLTINEILHYFFTNYELEETVLLIKCFDIFPEPNKKWSQYIFAYIFSDSSHVSTMIRLIEHKYIQFKGTEIQFQYLLEKIRKSRCDIGKYADDLTNIALLFEIDPNVKAKFKKLIKLIQIYHTFNINEGVEFLYDIVYANWANISESAIVTMSQNGLQLIKKIIINYFTQFDVKMRTIEFEQKQFCFSSIFQMVKFVQFLKKVFLNNFISNSITHQIFFKQLINHQHYVQIKALMSQDRLLQFDIDFQTIGMIVSDHIITLLTTKKIRKIQQTIKLLINILQIYPNSACSHYIVSYYNYLKYLQEKDIVLPLQMKENITTDNLYFIVNNYSNKIDQIDFNFLFTHQSCIKVQYTNTKTVFIPIVTDEFLKFKVYLCNKAFSFKKNKFGTETIEEVIRYEPPWIGTELVKILKENNNIDENFIAIAFNFCVRGEDLEYILSLASNIKTKQSPTTKLSLLKLKTWTSILGQDKYLILTDQLVINEALYKNLVAELTFNEGQQIKTNHFLFFHLLTIEPERSFNYAINYGMSSIFIVNFIMEGVKKGVIHMSNAVGFLIKFLYFYAKKEAKKLAYISLKEYSSVSVESIINNGMEQTKGGNQYVIGNFEKMIKNYHIQRIITTQFLDLYLPSKDLFKFLYEQPFRKDVLVNLREQPMSKVNSKVLKSLCQKVGIDILQLSLYNLTSKVNSKEQLDDQCWTIAQKLIHWGDDRKIAYMAVERLSQKIELLELFLNIVDYLRESQSTYRDIVSDHHLQIVRSLAAIEVDKNLYGIIPENFFSRPIGVYHTQQRGILSETHRRILKDSGCVENIFVLSKALYFIYGCSEEVQKVVLGEFSLQQEDSEEFEELRKKIKKEAEEL